MSELPKISQDMIRLYDEYTHLTLDRRGFMEKLTRLAGSGAAAAAIVPLIAANSAKAAMVAADDSRLATKRVSFDGSDGRMSGYMVMPAEAQGPLPGVVVIHENRGLNGHIEDVARRVALEGFVALAPDLLATQGGTPDDEDKARDMIRALDGAATIANAVAAAAYLKSLAETTDKVGVVGFCWGGGMVNQLAVHSPDITAAVAYYGVQPDAVDVPKIKARLLLHYAGLDQRVNAGIPAYEKALTAAGVDYTVHVYEGVNHAFNNDTAAARYDKTAADLAWSRTVAFLKESLG